VDGIPPHSLFMEPSHSGKAIVVDELGAYAPRRIAAQPTSDGFSPHYRLLIGRLPNGMITFGHVRRLYTVRGRNDAAAGASTAADLLVEKISSAGALSGRSLI
jgi:hypothetical protein